MRFILFASFSVLLLSCNNIRRSTSIEVVGKMSDVMWKGDIAGKISTDSLSDDNAYGLGPIEYLSG